MPSDKEVRDMFAKFQENCSKHMQENAETNARLETKVSRLCEDMKGVNTFLVKGNGKSISERMVILETGFKGMKETIERIEKKLDNGGPGVPRFALWRVIFRAVFGL